MIVTDNLKKSIVASNLSSEDKEKLFQLLDLMCDIVDYPSDSNEPKVRVLETQIAWLENELKAQNET